MVTWRLDPDHTVATFSVLHLTIAKVRGQFNRVTGSLAYSPTSGAITDLQVTIEVASLHTGIRKRDVHLVSPDFFSAVENPEITFRSTACEVRENRGWITGDLTIRGITRPVALEVTLTGPLKLPADLGGETTLGLSARTIINREEFGLTWNVPLDNGAVMIAREVAITLDGEADRSEE